MTNGSGPSNTDDAEVIRIRAAACQKLVDRFINEALPTSEFLQLLRETGATAVEAQEYAQQARDRLDVAGRSGHQPPPEDPRSSSREATPEGLDGEDFGAIPS
ncbi:hypothetical protein B0H13DRAFT_1887622 [Mycena leptocephala]|nr:hypothetical protein B0H13DRAFT_1887622 [Mycena leptocephala]